jgi:hypothetical protein
MLSIFRWKAFASEIHARRVGRTNKVPPCFLSSLLVFDPFHILLEPPSPPGFPHTGLLPKTSKAQIRPEIINRSRAKRPKPRSDYDSPNSLRSHHGLALARRRRRQRPGPRRRPRPRRRRGRGGAVRHAPGGAVPLPHGGGRARPIRPQVREDRAAPPRLRRQVR